MAYENITIDDPNFCMGMQDGTYSTIDLSDQGLKVKNTTGGQVGPTYTLSSNITHTLLSLEYAGPIDQATSVSGASFFTLEKESSTKCHIKRWELDELNAKLQLKSTITKTTAATDYYNAVGMAVEYYRRAFDGPNPGGINYIDMNSTSKITSGMTLFLGPSSDPDNPAANDYVAVSSVSGTRVYLTGNVPHQYDDGDDISFYKNVYLMSSLGFGGDVAKGTLFKLDPDTGVVLERNYEYFYKPVSVIKWCPYVTAVACTASTNMFFVRPYDSYQIWKSMYLNNVQSDKATVFSVYDVVFDNYEIYKLMGKITKRDNDGNLTTTTWTKYNYGTDTLLPYVNSINMYSTKSKMIGDADTTTLYLKVIDQFGVGLLNEDVDVDVVSGDGGVVLNPPDGQVTTDANGEASVGYTCGNTYEGITQISASNSTGGFTGHGSAWVWAFGSISSEQDFDMDTKIFQRRDDDIDYECRLRQIARYMTIQLSIFCRTFFTTPGGNWLNPSPYSGQVGTYLPTLHVGTGDGPAASFERGWNPGEADPPSFETRITQWEDFESWNRFRQIDDNFYSYNEFVKQLGNCIDCPTGSGVEMAPSDLKIDQLKLSHHTYWAAGTAYDYLWTQTFLDQFVFIEDAIPKFWSEKNPVNTNIWIRLRPFASDLVSGTLNFMVRESSYAGDTGYQDFTPFCTVTTFDAGGGIDGLDVLCNPPNDFHHNAIVYVHLEVYDALGNYIYTDYWFKITPDYRFPYLDNLNPDRDQTNVSVSSNIYFEIKDLGVGVDIDSLEMYVNSLSVTPSTNKISDNHYEVTYDPPQDFYYDKEVTVTVRVADSSENENTLIDSYRFYTVESSEVLFTGFDPRVCKRGFPKFQDVSFLTLGWGDGVDASTLRVQIHGLDMTDKARIIPIVYRSS